MKLRRPFRNFRLCAREGQVLHQAEVRRVVILDCAGRGRSKRSDEGGKVARQVGRRETPRALFISNVTVDKLGVTCHGSLVRSDYGLCHG